jgi:hypothetical protein
MGSAKYTDTQREFVRTAWAAGQSAAVIASSLMVNFAIEATRNGVISLARRMKLPARESDGPWRIEGQRRREAAIEAMREPAQKKAPTPPPKPSGAPLTILGPVDDFVGRGMCQFPVNQDGQPFQQCGHGQEDGRIYCGYHCSRAYAPTHKAKASGNFRSDKIR